MRKFKDFGRAPARPERPAGIHEYCLRGSPQVGKVPEFAWPGGGPATGGSAMPAKTPLILENRSLRLELDRRDLAAHVTVKSTGETLRMAAAQPDDVCLARRNTSAWKSFADSPITIRRNSRLNKRPPPRMTANSI